MLGDTTTGGRGDELESSLRAAGRLMCIFMDIATGDEV